MGTLATLSAPPMTILLTEGTSATLVDVAHGEASGGVSAPCNGQYFNNGWRAVNTGNAFCSAGQLGSTAFPCGSGYSAGTDVNFPLGRHLEGANFLFFDGHVKWLKGAAVSPGGNATSPKAAQGFPAGGAAGTSGTFSNGAPISATYSIN